MKKRILLLIALIVLCGCKSTSKTNYYSRTTIDAGFDTAITLHAYCEDEQTFDEYFELAKDTFLSYNQLFDPYHNYEKINNLKTINDNAGKQAVIVNKELFDVIALAKEYAGYTNGKFDVTYGAVLKLWHDERELALEDPKKAKLPNEDALQEAATHIGFDKVELDETKHSVFIHDSDASIDLGGVAKGYATQKVADTLKAAGLKHGIVDAGGNVKLIGTKPEGSWNVGIQIPDENNLSSQSILQVHIDKETSFVTSGDYQRFFEVDGVRYHHIIDPSTNYPASYMRSVTVICKDSAIADILSTSLFTMSYEDGKALLSQLEEKGIKAKAIWIFDDSTNIQESIQVNHYQVMLSEGLQKQVTFQK